jgi:hypothetical protein
MKIGNQTEEQMQFIRETIKRVVKEKLDERRKKFVAPEMIEKIEKRK